MRAELAAGITRWMAESHAAVAGVDLVMAGAGGLGIARSVAEAVGIPFVEAYLQPIGSATTAFPGVFAPHPPGWLGGPGRWMSHVFTNALLSLPHRPALRRARAEALGLPPEARKRDGAAPVLYGFSPHVVPPPRSWAGRRFVTGYWIVPLPADWSPPPDLAAFIAAGPVPVCIGFGSMPNDNPAALAELLVAASRRAGTRVVLLSGWGGLDFAGGDDVFVTDAVPHEWLFPRVAAVVHHGGAGTTGAGLRAGVPTVVVPHGADQPFWGTRFTELGVGPRPIPRRRLTVAGLAEALEFVLTDQAVRDRAAALGRQIRAEDGVGTAVGVINDFLVQSRR